MNIGQAASCSGISAKMIRHYESLGVLPRVGRTQAGYRVYGESELETLRFIRRARSFGLPMTRIAALVGLWQDCERPSAEVKRIATEHVRELRARMAELGGMCSALEELAGRCRGDDRPDCPILSGLAGVAA